MLVWSCFWDSQYHSPLRLDFNLLDHSTPRIGCEYMGSTFENMGCNMPRHQMLRAVCGCGDACMHARAHACALLLCMQVCMCMIPYETRVHALRARVCVLVLCTLSHTQASASTCCIEIERTRVMFLFALDNWMGPLRNFNRVWSGECFRLSQ